MKLFIFEPYSWAYCGGVIGIIAETYEAAIDLIVGEDLVRAVEEANKEDVRKRYPSNYSYDDILESLRSYRRKHFSKLKKDFKKGHWDQWLLTQTFDVPKEKKARVAFDNWNYA